MPFPEPPAARLEGRTLDGEWAVETRLDPGPKATGGNFSVGYLARHPSHGTAFLKALDFSRALAVPDVMNALQSLTESFNYECRVLEKCGRQGMHRIVKAVGTGTLRLPGEILPVPWVLFEHAACDIRAYLDATLEFDAAWALRALHHVAVGLNQLHTSRIAHQDLKPSNVLVFGGNSSKIADLGRADYRGHPAPWGGLEIAGDPSYAPPEHLYGHIETDWASRRQACDLYHLGSLILFLFTGASTTPAVLARLGQAHGFRVWRDDYLSVLPYVRDAFDAVASKFEATLAEHLRVDLGATFRELCEPDPTLRGHPKARIGHGNPYSLERYVARLDLLARRAETRLT